MIPSSFSAPPRNVQIEELLPESGNDIRFPPVDGADSSNLAVSNDASISSLQLIRDAARDSSDRKGSPAKAMNGQRETQLEARMQFLEQVCGHRVKELEAQVAKMEARLHKNESYVMEKLDFTEQNMLYHRGKGDQNTNDVKMRVRELEAKLETANSYISSLTNDIAILKSQGSKSFNVEHGSNSQSGLFNDNFLGNVIDAKKRNMTMINNRFKKIEEELRSEVEKRDIMSGQLLATIQTRFNECFDGIQKAQEQRSKLEHDFHSFFSTFQKEMRDIIKVVQNHSIRNHEMAQKMLRAEIDARLKEEKKLHWAINNTFKSNSASISQVRKDLREGFQFFADSVKALEKGAGEKTQEYLAKELLYFATREDLKNVLMDIQDLDAKREEEYLQFQTDVWNKLKVGPVHPQLPMTPRGGWGINPADFAVPATFLSHHDVDYKTAGIDRPARPLKELPASIIGSKSSTGGYPTTKSVSLSGRQQRSAKKSSSSRRSSKRPRSSGRRVPGSRDSPAKGSIKFQDIRKGQHKGLSAADDLLRNFDTVTDHEMKERMRLSQDLAGLSDPNVLLEELDRDHVDRVAVLKVEASRVREDRSEGEGEGEGKGCLNQDDQLDSEVQDNRAEHRNGIQRDDRRKAKEEIEEKSDDDIVTKVIGANLEYQHEADDADEHHHDEHSDNPEDSLPSPKASAIAHGPLDSNITGHEEKEATHTADETKNDDNETKTKRTKKRKPKKRPLSRKGNKGKSSGSSSRPTSGRSTSRRGHGSVKSSRGMNKLEQKRQAAAEAKERQRKAAMDAQLKARKEREEEEKAAKEAEEKAREEKFAKEYQAMKVKLPDHSGWVYRWTLQDLASIQGQSFEQTSPRVGDSDFAITNDNAPDRSAIDDLALQHEHVSSEEGKEGKIINNQFRVYQPIVATDTQFLQGQVADKSLTTLSGNILQLKSGPTKSGVITDKGVLWMWADTDQDDEKGWGEEQTAIEPNPTIVTNIGGVGQISVGRHHCAALTNSGKIRTWGSGMLGILGHNDDLGQVEPTRVRLLPQPPDYEVFFVATGLYNTSVIVRKFKTHENLVYIWGAGQQGQIGNGVFHPAFVPVRVPIPPAFNIIRIGLCASAVCALDDKGGVWTWGSNEFGQLGFQLPERPPVSSSGRTRRDGNMMRQYCSPRPQRLESLWKKKHYMLDVKCGLHHVTCLSKDHQLWSWGWANSWQLGIEENIDQHEPVLVKSLISHKIISYDVGGQISAALTSNSAVYVWGKGVQSLLPKNISFMEGLDLQSLSLGDSSSLFCLTGTGQTAYILPFDVESKVPQIAQPSQGLSLGKDEVIDPSVSEGALSLGPTVSADQFDFFRPQLTDLLKGKFLKDISLGHRHGCVIDTGGHAWCWGDNESFQLGLGHDKSCAFPWMVNIPVPVRSIAAGTTHTVALTETGYVYTWGSGVLGKLGHGDDSDVHTPKLVKLLSHLPCQAIGAGAHNSAAITEGGRLYVWGEDGKGSGATTSAYQAPHSNTPQQILVKETTSAPPSTQDAKQDSNAPNDGSKEQNELATSTSLQVYLPTAKPVIWRSVAFGLHHCAASTSNGTVYTWGQNDCGQLGYLSPPGTTTPSSVSNEDAGDVKEKRQLISSSSENGIGAGYSWEPSLVQNLANLAIRIDQVACGAKNTFFVTDDGKLYTCGSMESKQLGYRVRADQVLPRPVDCFNKLSIKKLSVGDYNCGVVTKDDLVVVWGSVFGTIPKFLDLSSTLESQEEEPAQDDNDAVSESPTTPGEQNNDSNDNENIGSAQELLTPGFPLRLFAVGDQSIIFTD